MRVERTLSAEFRRDRFENAVIPNVSDMRIVRDDVTVDDSCAPAVEDTFDCSLLRAASSEFLPFLLWGHFGVDAPSPLMKIAVDQARRVRRRRYRRGACCVRRGCNDAETQRPDRKSALVGKLRGAERSANRARAPGFHRGFGPGRRQEPGAGAGNRSGFQVGAPFRHGRRRAPRDERNVFGITVAL